VVKVKERLTGAIILVALIVLLVPELLTGPIRSAPRAAGLTRAAGEPPLRSYTINLAEERQAHGAPAQPSGPEQPAPLVAAAPPAGAPAAQAGSSEAASRSEAETAAPPAPPPVETPAAAAAPPAMRMTRVPASAPVAISGAAAGMWMVQLGSFASRANAEHLARQVRAQGFTASVSQGSSGRRLYRVRVGPARDRAAASALAQKLSASGHSGAIVPK
jgi:DedD protein